MLNTGICKTLHAWQVTQVAISQLDIGSALSRNGCRHAAQHKAYLNVADRHIVCTAACQRKQQALITINTTSAYQLSGAGVRCSRTARQCMASGFKSIEG